MFYITCISVVDRRSNNKLTFSKDSSLAKFVSYEKRTFLYRRNYANCVKLPKRKYNGQNDHYPDVDFV